MVKEWQYGYPWMHESLNEIEFSGGATVRENHDLPEKCLREMLPKAFATASTALSLRDVM